MDLAHSFADQFNQLIGPSLGNNASFLRLLQSELDAMEIIGGNKIPTNDK